MLADVQVESSASEDNATRIRLEVAVCTSLRDLAGSWHVVIRPANTPPWWSVSLRRTDLEFRQHLLVDPKEPDSALSRALEAALRGAV